MKKLLVVATLPIFTLLIFSINHFKNEYSKVTDNKRYLVHLVTMDMASNLIHELQIERGLSVAYLKQNKSQYFKNELKIQKIDSDKNIESFLASLKNINEKNTPIYIRKYIRNMLPILKNISLMRTMVISENINVKNTFDYYTILNNDLIYILNGFKFNTNSEHINSNIIILNRIIQLQEQAGQERALLTKLAQSNEITAQNMREFYNTKNLQDSEHKQLHILLKDTILETKLYKIDNKYNLNYFNDAERKLIEYELKKEIINRVYKFIGYGGMIHYALKYQKNKDQKYFDLYLEKKEKFDKEMENYLSLCKLDDKEYQTALKLQNSFEHIQEDEDFILHEMDILSLYRYLNQVPLNIDTKKWFKISSDRINDIHFVENRLFKKISYAIQTEITTTNNYLVYQVIATIFIITLILIGIFYISYKIKYSIYQLRSGVDNFFDFLNSKKEKPENIDTHSDDEINEMAENINSQMSIVEENFKEDKNFIHEITNIVTLMQDGNFTQKTHFKPNNPNLIELKAVFDELIELITQKIHEQTKSLESLNSSLEDRVYLQTIELEKRIEEITQARDKAIKAELAKDEFLANMSHEIRTPLNAILGFVTILKKTTKEEKSLKYLSIISSSGESLLTIINDILDFSKIKSGKFVISPHAVDPLEEFTNVTLLFASKAYEKDILYTVYIDPALPKSINIDITRVNQILSNLLSNAIKFTSEYGTIHVEVTINKDLLHISVADNGIGISEQNRLKIFSAFEQADGSTTRKYGGTGLGLSISSTLASLMNANLSLSSEEELGSTFTLEIPIEILDNTPHEHTDTDTIELHTLDKKELLAYEGSILIAEDNKTNQMLVSLILNDYKIKYDIVNNGLEAVDMFKKHKYNMVLMDENMPELNGIGAMRKIKAYEAHHNLQSTPIIVLTASVLENDKKMFINEGMDGFLGKPLNTKELEKELDKYLKRI